MNTKPPTAEKTEVTLIRDGVGREEHTLPEGATLADLLREAQAADTPHVTTINGRSIEEFLVLQPGMIVTVTPVSSSPITNDSWLETFGMFKDDAAFNEMVKAGRAYREALREADLKEAEDGEA